MSFDFLTDLDAFDKSDVRDFEYFVQTYLQQALPNADFSKGSVLYDLVVRPNAIMFAMNYINVNRYRRGSSLLDISKFPEAVDSSAVDAVLSNFGLTRLAGNKSAGTITIYLNSNVTTSIPSGSIFTSGTLNFITEQTFIGVPSADMVNNTTDRLIIGPDRGLYSFTIEVVAAEDGSEYQLAAGTTLAMQTPPSNYVSAAATYDFSTGAGAETNTEMLTRLAGGISGKTLASRRHIRAFIEEMFPGTQHGSVIGFGDPEMQRDKNNIFQTSCGGKSDIYVQTDVRPLSRVSRMTAVLVDKLSQTWQISIDRDTFAGVYKVESVKPVNSTDYGTLAITTDVRSISKPAGQAAPELMNYSQAAFSRFQSAVIEFIDPFTDTSSMTPFTSTNEYDVSLLGLPSIASIQDNLVSDRWYSSLRYDDLVRAPIPCLLSVTVKVRIPIGTAIDEDATKQAIAARINDLGFTDQISTSVITDVIHGMIDAHGMVVMPVDFYGELISPTDGQPVVYRSASTLKIPTDYLLSISNKTVMFFCNPADIDIYTETF